MGGRRRVLGRRPAPLRFGERRARRALGRVDRRRTVGWIQCYAWADCTAEEEAQTHFALGVEASGAGIDYLIGDPARRGEGLGSTVIRSFVHTVVFAHHPGWLQVSAGPYVANEASWRALSRAGFRVLGDYSDEEGEECRVMALDRPRSDPA